MSRAFRRILFFSFVLVFAFSAAVLLFFASGYRYHVAKRVIEKTGAFIVETQPRGARVIFNDGVTSGARTPLTVSSLLSGTYLVTIEKEGFFPVTRRISIMAGRSVVANDIVLIKKGEPRLLAPLEGVRWAVLRASRTFVYDARGLHTFDLAAKRLVPVLDLSNSAARVQVSPGGTLLVVKTPDGWSVRDQSAVLISSSPASMVFEDMRFAQDADALYARAADGIYRFEKEKRAFVPIVKKKGIRSFDVSGDILTVVQSDNRMQEIRASNGAGMREIADVPLFEDILVSAHGILVLKGEGRSAYLFDRTARTVSFQHMSDVTSIRFLDRERFFSFNDFEVWEHVFSPVRYARTLVTRQSMPIADILPFANRRFIVIVSQRGEVRLRNLGDEDGQEVLLAEFDFVSGIFIDKKETTLTVVGSYRGQDGIYALTVTEEDAVFPLVK